MDYHPFINMFKAVIDMDANLSFCEKLYYLRSFLAGGALDLIKHLMLTGENYEVALKLLNDRYNNIPKIVSFHVNSILDMPVLTKCTASGLRSIVSTVNMHLAALKNLNEKVEFWDTILVNILSRKIDSYTYRGFYLERGLQEVPKLCELLTFLEKRAIALEATMREEPKKRENSVVSAAAATGVSCKYCQDTHKIYECAKFKLLPYEQRCEFVDENNLCKLCLNGHRGRCLMRLKCATCHELHNTLLHSPNKGKVTNVSLADEPSLNVKDNSKSDDCCLPTDLSRNVSLSARPRNASVLLPSVIVKLKKKDGTFTHARALLDSCSQIHFVSEKLIKEVGICTYDTDEVVTGVCERDNNIAQKADLVVYSTVGNFKVDVSCCVTRKITCALPQQTFDISQFNIPSYAQLADEKFNESNESSLLLGADVFFQVFEYVCRQLTPVGPYLVKTRFGHIVGGGLPFPAGKKSISNYCVTTKGNPFHFNVAEDDLQPPFPCAKQSEVCLLSNDCQPSEDIVDIMSKFWDCEKVPDIIKETGTEAEQAEQIFLESVKLENDKFTVAMPVKVELDKLDLGDSFSCALQRFFNLEKRFSRDLELSKKYKKFIHDYIDQGHAKYFDMSTYDLSAGNVMFLPHHPVISSSKTTPVRAVFDAGAVTKKGICLNDILLNGPVVQKDLFEILILFRTFKYVLLCDIKAMYRQILIEDKYRCLQNILWRDSPDDSVKCVQLQTVTYGLKNSAFLACRCLLELAQRYESQYPLASFVLKHTCYVDDIQCGSNDLNELIQMKKELVDLMKLASLSLHKWCSNNQEILSDIPVEFHQLDSRSFDKNNEYVKTLGLTYDVITDTLNMQCPVKEVQEKYTKRQMLSFISKFFDPLGLCGPVLVQAKILMQQVWFESLKWDEFLPQGLNQKWVDFANSLVQMSCISIARNINVQGAQSLELVGFSDASNAAHGCCLYLRVIDADNKVSVNLLCSKSRINPKAKSLTIPKLELNGALLLAILARKVYTALSLKYSVSAHLYSDSMILLAWLKTLPVKLNMYVGNRVDKINKLSSGFEWHYDN
ncbi:uncharacterized protein LOC134749140 isoform X1 [Cydia strobilella]|uniref:uncharacterized protein LOC134749140 isoform X1 n=3 Tax=Cydia strobilella TaxID=1100964 RepID=UPI0030057BCE